MVYTWMTTLFTFAGKDGLIDKDWDWDLLCLRSLFLLLFWELLPFITAP